MSTFLRYFYCTLMLALCSCTSMKIPDVNSDSVQNADLKYYHRDHSDSNRPIDINSNPNRPYISIAAERNYH